MRRIVTRIIGGFINVTAVFFPKWNAQFSFNLLSRVKRIGVSENGRRFLEKGESSYLEIDEHSAVLHSWGSGNKNVLFLHGWMSNSQRWAPYLDHLDLDEHKVYALDAPGHGMAEGKYLNLEIYRKALLAALHHIGEVDTLICHSLGGLVSGYSYLHNKDLAVNRYVIMGAPSGMDAIFTYFEETIGISGKAYKNLENKINDVLMIPHEEIAMTRFFAEVERPVLVVHDVGDRITPFEPIKRASEMARNGATIKGREKKEIITYFTEGEDHGLRSPQTVERVIQFIKN